MTGQQSFAVYLTEEASPDDGPLEATGIDFYDSGVWVSHAAGRDFFPYERVLRIQEGGPDAGDDDRPTGERRDAASGTAGAVDQTNLDVE
jgi:hypothetical protein